MSGNVAFFDDLRRIAYGSIGSSYSAFGTKIDKPTRIVHIFNDTDVNVLLSTDGTKDKLILPPAGFILFDFSTNRASVDSTFVLHGSFQWWIKHDGAAPTARSVYLTVII